MSDDWDWNAAKVHGPPPHSVDPTRTGSNVSYTKLAPGHVWYIGLIYYVHARVRAHALHNVQKIARKPGNYRLPNRGRIVRLPT
jgi:hypothetical protein